MRCHQSVLEGGQAHTELTLPLTHITLTHPPALQRRCTGSERRGPSTQVFQSLPHPTCAAEEVRKEWKKAAKHDAAVRMAAVLHDAGKEGVAADYEQVRALFFTCFPSFQLLFSVSIRGLCVHACRCFERVCTVVPSLSCARQRKQSETNHACCAR